MSEPKETQLSREQRIGAYLSDRMSDSETEAFEREMFSDDELATEVERALEIKASADEASEVPDRGNAGGVTVPVAETTRLPPRSRHEFRWIGLAAAFSAVAVAGVLWLTRVAQEPLVMRAGEERLAVQSAAEPDGTRLTWPAVPGAMTYRIAVFTPTGDALGSDETKLTTYRLRDGLRRDRNGPVFVRVVAIDHLRREIGDSGLVRITD
jgi:hypothetical protein